MSASVQNLEEAAAIASEYISTLDNLPNEVQHLLHEIRHKESRSQELQQEAQKEGSRYIRHTLRNVQSQSGSTPLPSPIQTKEKDALIPAKVEACYAEIDKLSAEKQELAQRVVELITRARARLEFDLGKVLVLQGEAPEVVSGLTSAHSAASGGGGLGGGSFTLGGRNPVNQINESLRNAFAGSGLGGLGPGDVLPLSPVGQAAAELHKNKRRRVGPSVSNASIKLPSPAPANQYAPSQRSRLSQAHPRNSPARARRDTSLFGMDDDAEGEEDYEENGDDVGDEDKQIYCFCQKLSYGEMIACDNPECAYQWFHLPCVGVKPPLPEHFYCSECLGKGANQKKKGRRK